MDRPPPARHAKPALRRAPRRLGLFFILAGVLLVLLWVGLKIGRSYQAARQGLAHLSALQTTLQSSPQAILDDFPAFKAQVVAANQDMATLRAETAILDPLLTRLEWVPRYGPELAATPHLTAMAADLSSAGADLAAVFEAVLPVLEESGDDSLSQALLILQDQQPLLRRAYASLQHAAYERTFLDPTRLDDEPYARIAPLLQELDEALPSIVRAMGMLDVFLPQADAVLGMDAPRRYLIVGQNNFELRATGGFMGSMGILTVDQGRITQLDYRSSYDWDNPKREKVQPPIPYVRYMRFGAWFIRDANFSPDFPTSAQTIEMFWQLDGHEPVQGVIALDMYALQNVLQALGPVEVPGYGVSVGGSNMLETIWEGYRRDPGFLPALSGAVAARLQQPGLFQPANLPALLQSLARSLEEKHILLYFDAADLQQAVVRAGWSGALRDDPGDYLYVVDSDFSYAEVNRFIEQEIRYTATLDRGLKVQESTVTITYWNHFDRWSSAETREQFGGGCYDPATRDLVHSPGCYGDYIRLAVPRGSRFVSAAGFDDGMEYQDEAGRTIIAGYVRVLPGDQRTVSITYIPPANPVGGQYRLTLQKQPGTAALPVDVEIRVAGDPPAAAGLRTDLRTDRVLTASWRDGSLVLSGGGATAAPPDARERARQEAFAAGLALWEAGRRDEAVDRWREAAAADLVLDRANLLLSRGDLEGTALLCQAALQIDAASARAHFLLGKAALARGDAAQAQADFARAVELQPDNYAAQLELGLLYEAQGDVENAYAHLQLADPQEANQALWGRAWPYFNSGLSEAGLAALRLIIRLDPADANAHYVLADQLRVLKRYDESLAAYDALRQAAPQDVRFYIGRGQLYADQGQGDAALADLGAAVQLAPRSAESWFYLGQYRWRFQKDLAGATAALQQAVTLDPNAWYATALGNVLREAGELDLAAQAYEQATRLEGASAYTWVLLGGTYEALGRSEAALAAYGSAVDKDPQGGWTHAALAAAYERAGRTAEAIAAYEAALALEPENAAWQQALDRLKP